MLEILKVSSCYRKYFRTLMIIIRQESPSAHGPTKTILMFENVAWLM